jgi:hypothetical protein
MSIVDEQDLRVQLDAVLDAISPPEAPVSAAARKGKVIQAGRSLGIVTGLAIVAGIGVGIPGLFNRPALEVSRARPTVMVQQACTTVPRGGQGTAITPELAAERAEPRSSADAPRGGRPAPAIAAGGCAWLKP